MAKQWREVVGRRNRTSKTKRLYEDGQPTRHFSWDGIVGTSVHYPKAGEWLEVDARIVPSSKPGWDWEMIRSHWRFLARNGGWFAAEKQGVGIGFRLERVAYLNIQTKEWQTIRTAQYGIPTVEEVPTDNDLLPNPIGKLTWTDLFPNVDFEIHTSPDRLGERIAVSQAARDAMPALPYPAADTYLVLVYLVDWGQVPGLVDDGGDIDYETDFERQARLCLKNHQGEIITALPASRAWPAGHPVDADGEPIEVPLRKRFVNVAGQHYLLVGAPVLALNALPEGTIIFDPDVDEQVGFSVDDGGVHGGGIYVDSNQEIVGCLYGVYDIWARWRGVSASGTITASYMEEYADAAGQDTPELTIYGIDEDDPAAPTTYAEYYDDPLTDASVEWDGVWTINQWAQSPSLNGIFQELVDSHTIDDDAVMVQVRNRHDNPGGSYHANTARMWDYSGNVHGAKLHIEYSAPPAGNPWYCYAQQQ